MRPLARRGDWASGPREVLNPLRKVPKSCGLGEYRRMTPQRLAFGPFVLDQRRGVLLREGQPVALGQKGLALLQALLLAPGEVLDKAALMRAAWRDAAVEESNLSVQIAALRMLLGTQPDGGEWIATIPRVGYRFAADVEVLDPAPENGPSAPGASPEGPSIAVLPFANIGDDREQEYLADGITEDIITTLTRFRWFRVIGRSSCFAYKGKPADSKEVARDLGVRYVLEGSVRRSGRQLRISAQLVDAASARQIWAERYEMELQGAFSIQDAIAERVAGAIEPELLRTESLPSTVRPRGNPTARDLVRQGTWHFHRVGHDTHLQARELFRRARSVDPELAEAHAWLARVSAGIVAYGWSDQAGTDIREGLEAGVRAIQLDEKNPYSHYAFAICSAYACQPEQAVLAAEKAVELSPSFALGHLVLGMGKLFQGRAIEAIAPLERGLTLNPHDPQNFVWYNLLSLAHLFAGKAQDALAAAIKARKVRPAWRPIHATLACCHAALERMEEAAQCIARMGESQEEPSGDALEPLRFHNPHWAREMARLLDLAGRHGAGPPHRQVRSHPPLD